MRNMLLGGKLLAVDAGAKEISLAHLRAALTHLQPVSDNHYRHLCAELNLDEEITPSERFTSRQLEETATLPRLPYDADVLLLLDRLKRAGLDLASEITEPFVNLRQRQGRYQAVVADVAELRALLERRIFDQDAAIEAVSDAVMRMSWSASANRPQAIFSFLGPPATGKTYMAQLMGQGLQGRALRTFDMTQFNSEKESFGLVGLRKGFSDASAGMLTEFVKQHPRAIIVFDELEKSHSRVQSALLRMLSEGQLRDEHTGEEIDFRQTILVFTSNLGSSLWANRTFAEQTRQQPHQAREHLLQAIAEEQKIEEGHRVAAIAPEMISRLAQGSIILFNRLSMSALTRIAGEQIQTDRKAFEDNLGLAVHFRQFDSLLQLLVLCFAPDFDTRALKSRLTDLVYDPITDYLLQQPEQLIERVELEIDAEAKAFLKQDLQELCQQLANKHQRVYFDHRIESVGSMLILHCHRVRIEKLARSEDFQDASGIQVDLPQISFDQIAGHLQIKARLRETIKLVRNRDQLEPQGIKAPRGMLLYGVPGTGKTLLAGPLPMKRICPLSPVPATTCSMRALSAASSPAPGNTHRRLSSSTRSTPCPGAAAPGLRQTP